MKKHILLLAFLISLFLPSVNVHALIVPVNENTVTQKAITAFNQLSKKEKKHRIYEVKKQVNLFKKNMREGRVEDERTILLVILAILLPPLAVYLYENAITTKFWISLILTLLFWVPGIIYALLVVLGVV